MKGTGLFSHWFCLSFKSCSLQLCFKEAFYSSTTSLMSGVLPNVHSQRNHESLNRLIPCRSIILQDLCHFGLFPDIQQSRSRVRTPVKHMLCIFSAKILTKFSFLACALSFLLWKRLTAITVVYLCSLWRKVSFETPSPFLPAAITQCYPKHHEIFPKRRDLHCSFT